MIRFRLSICFGILGRIVLTNPLSVLFMLIVVPFICSCSGSDEIEETVQELTGSVSFSIDMPGDGGEGTVSSPIVVGMGKSLDMKIRQQNSYTATDGTVHTCEPVATIALHAESDTITARDLQELLRVGDTADTNTSTSGSNPMRSSTRQTFTIGGQRIVFDLTHEIFSITNSAGNAVEMPYLKVNPANFGNSSASETRSGAFVSGVSVRPVQADVTRAGTIVDSTKYEVEVRFNLDLEGIHTSSATRRNLVFAVSYIGIVEEVTQLYDPKSELNFSWSSGTSAASSPFVWNIKGADKSLVLTLNEKSEYINMFGHTMSCSPKAQIALRAESDTVYVKSKDELEDKGTVSTPQVSQTGNNPVKNTASYSFSFGGQKVSFSLDYESGYVLEDSDIGENVVMPNVRFGVPSLKGIELEEQTGGNARGLILYNVHATFVVDVISDGLQEESTERIEIVATYIGAIEPKLVRVTYKRDWEWVEPHDNMALFYYAKVHRTRHYSNGESFTDTFMDYGHMASKGYVIPQYEEPVKWEGGEIYFYQNPVETITYNDSIRILKRSSTVKAPEDAQLFLKTHNYLEGWLDSDEKVGNWELYDSEGKFYDEQNLTLDNDVVVDGDIGEPIPEYLKDRRSGWYFGAFVYQHIGSAELFIQQGNETIFIECVSEAHLREKRYDQYLLLDGRMFTFIDKDIRPDAEFSHKAENIPGGWQVTHEMRFKHMGRNFYLGFFDTIMLNP